MIGNGRPYPDNMRLHVVFDLYCNSTAFRAVFDGIADDVYEDLPDAHGVNNDIGIRNIGVKFNLNLL